jgi:hypothetical protein
MTKYLRFNSDEAPSVLGRYVLQLKRSFEWVTDIESATADYLPAVQATQSRLRNELNLDTRLEEIPDEMGGQSQWVICTDSDDRKKEKADEKSSGSPARRDDDGGP